ncbi:MAG: tetratricopeptide repeat protein [Bacteroidota bacterium]
MTSLTKSTNVAIVFFSLLLSVHLLSAQPDERTRVANEYMVKGRSALSTADYQQAISSFDQVILRNQNYPDVYAYRGNAFLLTKDYRRAEEDFSRAIDNFVLNRRNQGIPGFNMGDMIMVQPGEGQGVSLAMIYNNRGISRFFLGRRNQAAVDFEAALRIDKGLDAARQNLRRIRGGAVADVDNGGMDDGGFADNGGLNSRPTYDRYARPASVPQPRDPKISREKTDRIRDLRTIEITDEGRSRGGLFSSGPKPRKPFVKRNIPRRGKLYRMPMSEGKAHANVEIESVLITSRSTQVKLKITNEERKDFEINVAAKGSPGAFYLTDRTGSARNTFKLRRAEGIETYPRSTKLIAGETLYVTLEFDKIHDHIGFVNLIEGDKQGNEAWNFYGIDLTGQK